jgi:putative ABC transport system substrate-binding protein
MTPWHPSTEGFRDGLAALGLREGSEVTFDVRATHGDPSALPRLYEELTAEKPNLLVCISDTCRRDNRDIPMIFLQIDPILRGLVHNIARPEGNVTGISDMTSEMAGKRLELFKDIVPSLKRVLVTYDPRQSGEREALFAARSAATRLGIQLLEQPITDRLEMEPGLAELTEGGGDGILIVQAGTNLNIPGRSFEVAYVRHIPTMYTTVLWANVGALAAYGPDFYAQGRQAARIAQKIVAGTSPGDIPTEQPERFVFILNLKTAKALGIELSPQILTRADLVVE